MSVSTTSSAALSACGELGHQIAGSRVAVRLEHDQQPAAGGSGRGNHRADLRRMVPVVVDHHHAVALASHLEAPLGAGELGEGGGDPGERHLQLDANRHGAQRVQQVVAAGDGHRHLSERLAHAAGQAAHRAARGERFEPHVLGGDVRLDRGARRPQIRR